MMARGRRPDPKRADRGTGHRPDVGESITQYDPCEHDAVLVASVSESLPSDTARVVFDMAIEAVGDRLNSHDVFALQRMAIAFHNSVEADADVVENGMFQLSAFGNRVANPALKIARDETNVYLKIADQYALTFVSRLRAGILQLAGQSMLQHVHESMAEAIVARIVAQDESVDAAVIHTVLEPERCHATTKKGERCKNRAKHGSQFCGVHQ